MLVVVNTRFIQRKQKVETKNVKRRRRVFGRDALNMNIY